MALIVENGSGVFGANSYGTIEECTSYLEDRGDTSWALTGTLTEAQKSAALIQATDYIEKKYGTRFSGIRSFPIKRSADATLKFSGQPNDNDTITIGSVIYRFVTTLAQANDVQIDSRLSVTMLNLIAAINFQVGFYHPSTLVNQDVYAVQLDGRNIVLQARYDGEDGNEIVVQCLPPITSNSPTLTGGNMDGISQPLSFPRVGIYMEGSPVRGIPQILKFSTFELAKRAIEDDLLPDPEQDASGRTVVMKSEKVGPIEDTVKFSGFAQIENLMRVYPAAEKLLRPLLGSGNGGVSR